MMCSSDRSGLGADVGSRTRGAFERTGPRRYDSGQETPEATLNGSALASHSIKITPQAPGPVAETIPAAAFESECVAHGYH